MLYFVIFATENSNRKFCFKTLTILIRIQIDGKVFIGDHGGTVIRAIMKINSDYVFLNKFVLNMLKI
jgi:hypothetical protein